ncbi:MAG: TetR/AcrR family transcriptional regulator [Lachnospiraceae bacterium]|nr:TetR/AcrR family transcriptional regulator [Lachnospiraceae bacterium]
MERETDRRIRKTKNSIRESFMELIMEKNFSEITVKEIASRADISRRTFYMHYSSIDAILDEMNAELSQRVQQLFYNRDFTHAQMSDIKDLFCELNEILNRNYAFYKRLCSLDSYGFFVQMLNLVLKDIIATTLEQTFHLEEQAKHAYSEYISGGIISLYVNWLRTDSNFTLDQLVDIAAQITYGGIRSLVQQP